MLLNGRSGNFEGDLLSESWVSVGDGNDGKRSRFHDGGGVGDLDRMESGEDAFELVSVISGKSEGEVGNSRRYQGSGKISA
jgi:hypothetical protein